MPPSPQPRPGRQERGRLHALECTQYLITQRLFLPICLCHNMVECSSVSRVVSEKNKDVHHNMLSVLLSKSYVQYYRQARRAETTIPTEDYIYAAVAFQNIISKQCSTCSFL